MSVTLIDGDCLAALKLMQPASVDAVVTDPPAGIEFMGKEWDSFRDKKRSKGWACGGKTGNDGFGGFAKTLRPAFCTQTLEDRAAFIAFLSSVLAECLRVAKPGARLLCWAIPRTSHWTGTAIEDAGWIVENKVYHLFGSGFPKGKTQLKPAAEEWILARKPSPRVPPLNIDAARIGTERTVTTLKDMSAYHGNNWGTPGAVVPLTGYRENPPGRWPPNVALSHLPECVELGTRRVAGSNRIRGGRESTEAWRFHHETGQEVGYADPDGMETVPAWRCAEGCPVAMLDAQAGESHEGNGRVGGGDGQPKGLFSMGSVNSCRYPGDGSASRFFPCFQDEPTRFRYEPKASRAERNAGLRGMPESETLIGAAGHKINPMTGRAVVDLPRANHHPCVKATALMRWLISLIAQPGQWILDPFAGSGSTMVAAVAEECHGIGIEQDADYMEIMRRRVARAEAQGRLELEVV